MDFNTTLGFPSEDEIVINKTYDESIAFTPPTTNEEALASTRFIVQKILVPIITSVGLCGNVISIRVLTHRSMVSSTNCYLTALAIFDVLYLVFSFSLSLNHYESVKLNLVYGYWFPYGRVLTDICSNVSVCLTVTFSLERLVAVSYPMKGRVLCTPRRAKLTTLFVVIFAVACTIPELFETKMILTDNEFNQTVVKHVSSKMAESDGYRLGYYNFFVFTFTVLPLILLSTFNGMLVRTVFTAIKLRKRMVYTALRKTSGSRQTEQNRITIMLIIVVIVFLICQFPYAVLLLYGIYLDSQSVVLTPNGYNNMKIAGNVVNLLVLINASINFVLYSVMSTKFRKVAVRLFCTCSDPRREPVTDTTSYHNGNWFRSSEVPFRYRSVHRSHIGEQSSSGIYSKRRCRNVHFCDQTFHKNARHIPPLTGPSNSFESSNDSTDAVLLSTESSTSTPLRKVPKNRTSILGKSKLTEKRFSGHTTQQVDESNQSDKCQLHPANIIRIQMTVKHRSASPCGVKSINTLV